MSQHALPEAIVENHVHGVGLWDCLSQGFRIDVMVLVFMYSMDIWYSMCSSMIHPNFVFLFSNED